MALVQRGGSTPPAIVVQWLLTFQYSLSAYANYLHRNQVTDQWLHAADQLISIAPVLMGMDIL
mgnify:CR=1 FL=1